MNIFRLTSLKLRIGLEDFKGVFARVWFNLAMTSDHLSFASVEIYIIIRWLYPGGKVCLTGGHVTSRKQGLRAFRALALRRIPSDEGLTLGWRRADESLFRISLQWPIHIINPVDKTKLSSNTTHVICTTVFFRNVTYPFLSHNDKGSRGHRTWERGSFSNSSGAVLTGP